MWSPTNYDVLAKLKKTLPCSTLSPRAEQNKENNDLTVLKFNYESGDFERSMSNVVLAKEDIVRENLKPENLEKQENGFSKFRYY